MKTDFAEITLNLIAEAFNVEIQTEDKAEKITELQEYLESQDLDLNFFNYANDSISYKDNNNFVNLEILVTCCEATGSDFDDFELYEIIDLINEIEDKKTDDFYIDSLPCGEVRLIDADEIDQIWTDSLIEQIKDCYNLDVPDFVCIDWEQTAENCKVDGKGHHFGTYDGEEYFSNGYYIFRTN